MITCSHKREIRDKDEGRLTVGWINFFAAALLIVIDIVYAIDVIIKGAGQWSRTRKINGGIK